MKQIQVIVTGTAHVSTTGINLTEAMKLSREARRNRLKIIEGALSVENQLEAVILHYFFGASHERRVVFESLVLNSDWCSFAAKRKLIAHIISEQNLLERSNKNEFEKLMKKEGLLSSFEKLSYTHRKEYCRWITEAKKEETRSRRLEKAVEMLKKGVKTPG